MPIGGIGQGFSEGLADYLKTERERNRKQEDDQLNYHMELIKALANRPDINERPEIMGQAIHDMLELANAKGGKGKPKAGMAGFMGSHELPVSQFLSGFSSGIRPIVGPTQEQNPETPWEPIQASLSRLPGVQPAPTAPPPEGGIPGMAPMTSMATSAPSVSPIGQKTPEAPTGGESILNAPIALPPQGTPLPAEAKRMAGAGYQMQAEAAIHPPAPPPLPEPQMRPVSPARQPYFRSPEEMAQQAGNAAGIKETAIEDAKNNSELKYLRSFMSDEEIKQMKLQKAMGGSQNVFQTDKNPDQYDVPGVDGPIDGYSRSNSRTGGVEVVDRYGRPLPPGAVRRVKAPPAGSIDQQELDSLVAAEETKLKRKLTPAEKAVIYDKFQTQDANRKKSNTTINLRNASGLTGDQQFRALNTLQQQWRKVADPYSTMINQYNLMQQGLKQAAKGNMNAGSQAVLVTFQKILDPKSVVRESEYARSPEGVGLISRIQGSIERLSKGGAGVPLPELRKFGTMAKQFLDGLEHSLDSTRSQLSTAAISASIDPKAIFGDNNGLPTIGTPPSGVVSKQTTKALVQQYATEHHVDYGIAAKAFTDKGYVIQ